MDMYEFIDAVCQSEFEISEEDAAAEAILVKLDGLTFEQGFDRFIANQKEIRLRDAIEREFWNKRPLANEIREFVEVNNL